MVERGGEDHEEETDGEDLFSRKKKRWVSEWLVGRVERARAALCLLGREGGKERTKERAIMVLRPAGILCILAAGFVLCECGWEGSGAIGGKGHHSPTQSG